MHHASQEIVRSVGTDNARSSGQGILFGGVLILLAGDFRQILPVISRSTAADEINACLKQLLDIGNGRLPVDNLTGLVTPFSSMKKRTHRIRIPKHCATIYGSRLVERACNISRQEQRRRRTEFCHSKCNSRGNGFVQILGHCHKSGRYGELSYRIFKFTGIARIATAQSTVESWIGDYHAEKYKPTTSGTRLAVKKLMSNVIEATERKGNTKAKTPHSDGANRFAIRF